MPKNSKDKLMSIVNFLRDSVSQVSSDVEDLDKSLNTFLKTLSKAQKDLKGIKVGKGEIVEEETPAIKAEKVTPTPSSGIDVREKAAATLFNMLSSSKKSEAASETSVVSAKASSSSSKGKKSGVPAGPPSKPSGPPSGPPSGVPAGPPSKPAAGKSSLPPPPKMPPAPGKPSAPSIPEGAIKTPSFVKEPTGPPTTPAAPKLPGKPKNDGATKPAAPSGAGVTPESFGSLRDEMLKELDRLKKIMRGN